MVLPEKLQPIKPTGFSKTLNKQRHFHGHTQMIVYRSHEAETSSERSSSAANRRCILEGTTCFCWLNVTQFDVEIPMLKCFKGFGSHSSYSVSVFVLGGLKRISRIIFIVHYNIGLLGGFLEHSISRGPAQLCFMMFPHVYHKFCSGNLSSKFQNPLKFLQHQKPPTDRSPHQHIFLREKNTKNGRNRPKFPNPPNMFALFYHQRL